MYIRTYTYIYKCIHTYKHKNAHTHMCVYLTLYLFSSRSLLISHIYFGSLPKFSPSNMWTCTAVMLQ